MPGREGHNSRSLPASKPMAGPQRSRIFWDPDVSRYRLTTQRANDQIRHGNVYGKQGRIQKVELGEDGQCRSAAVSRKILEGSSKWGGENETPRRGMVQNGGVPQRNLIYYKALIEY